MLHIIIGTDIDARKKKRDILSGTPEVIALDDSVTTFRGLVEYAFPSLFSIGTPVVHAKYLLEKKEEEGIVETISTLVTSPTVFILEEYTLSATTRKQFEKHGAHIHEYKEVKKGTAPSSIFSVTNALTARSKKDRWLAYQETVQEHPAEALIGILFWKLRQLLETPSSQRAYYKELYTQLMLAQKRAWQKGFPLSLAIEKVLLEV